MPKDIYAVVGNNVRRERLRAELTMERLAEMAGISPSFLAYIETRGRKASLATVQKLAAALRLPVTDLLKGAPPPAKGPAYDASRQFIHLVRDQKDAKLAAILNAVKALTQAARKKKRR